MSVDEAHLVAETLGDAGDEVLDVADGGADGGSSLAGAEPGVDLELAATIHQLKIEVEVLEVAGQLPPGTLHLDHLRLHPDRDPLRDLHRIRRQYRLHLSSPLPPPPMQRAEEAQGGGGQKPILRRPVLHASNSTLPQGQSIRCLLRSLFARHLLHHPLTLLLHHSSIKEGKTSSKFSAL